MGSDLPGVANTGNPLASFLLGQVQTFAIDIQQTTIQNRAHFQEYFVQDDWRVSDRLTVNAGVRYTLNFPSNEINGQTAVFNLQTRQLDYPGTEPVRPLKKNNFGPRVTAVYRLTDKGEPDTITKIPGGMLDGLIAIDAMLIVSSWSTKTIYRGPLGGAFTPLVTKVQGVADMGYDTKRKRLLVPRFLDDTVEVYDLK